MIWRPIDWLGDWLRKGLSTRIQTRVGVICTALSIPVAMSRIWWFQSEPVAVFEMSAAALVITGVCIVIAAVPSE